MGIFLSSNSQSREAKRLILCLLLALVLGISCDPNTHIKEELEKHSQKECGFTRYPDLCMATLSGLALGNQRDGILSALVEKVREETKLHTSSLPEYSSFLQLGLQSQHPRFSSIGRCLELMDMSVKRLNQSLSALKAFRPHNKPDVQTWLSAVLTFQETCKDAVKDNDHLPGDGDQAAAAVRISGQMDHLSKLASNALALVNRISSHHQEDIPDSHVASGGVFPTWVYRRDRKLLQSSGGGGGGMAANAVVAKDGTGDYKSIAEAIDAASAAHGGRFVIHVKAGFYKEKIHVKNDNIVLIGDGKYVTVISNDDSQNAGSSLVGSATVSISGNGFIAKDIGFENTAGPGGAQALALVVESDRSVFYRCMIRGYQDTLYALALRQFYRECDIAGTIDFIFGNAAAVFQGCNLILRRPQRSAYNVMLANGRSDPGQNTGFSVQNCKIMAGADLAPYRHSIPSFLGRPWKQYSRAVVMESEMDDAIAARGWVEWSGGFALKSLYFGEYENSGAGAGTSRRVEWAGYHVIGAEEAAKFTVAKFIAGNSWLPSTGVMFDSGL
ncbi:hypothetical protein ACLOJK_025876 [Asimina triloba]